MNARKTPLFSSPFQRISCDDSDFVDIGVEADNLAELGLAADYRSTVWQAVERWYRTGTQPFVSLCIRRKGVPVVHRSIGHRDMGSSLPITHFNQFTVSFSINN